MTEKILPEEKAFTWKAKDKEVKLRSLKDLLKALISIKQEDIDEVVSLNVKDSNLLGWLEENFPERLELIAELKENIKEFTPQQMRERLARDLRKAIEET